MYDELDDNDKNDILLRPASTSDITPLTPRGKKNYNTEEFDMTNMINKKLGLFTKICFALGGIPYQMTSNALGLYIAPFLLEIAQIRPYQISIVLFAARGWDAITDPLIGFFVSKTNTRFGKLRPWILFATPFAIITYMMIWYVPNLSSNLKTFWYLFFYCLFQTFLSCLHVPYTSLTMYLTTDQADRDSATSYRMIFEIIGVLLAAGIQGLMITIYGSLFDCNATTEAPILTTVFNQTTNLMTSKSPSYSKLGEGYLISAGVMCVIYVICTFATFFGTKEMRDVIEDKDKQFFSALKSVFTHKSYITLLFAFLFNSLSIQIVQTNFALYCKYAIDAGDIYQFVLIVLLVASIVSLPLWNFTMLKYGKKTTYAAGLIIFIPCLFVLLYLEKSGWYLYLIAVICGLGISVNYLLPWSMLPDVIDEFMMQTGKRRESIFYSFYVFFTKLSAGLAVALSTAFLDLGGYIDCPNGCCTQPESVGQTLRLLITPAPVIMLLIALVFIWKHPIDEKRRKEIKEKLIQIRENNNK